MSQALPERVLAELDQLFDNLTRQEEPIRNRAMSRLMEYEKSGSIPLEALIDMTREKNPVVSMYAIGALGRNGSPQAVSRLLEMANKAMSENPLVLETLIEAMGAAKAKETVPFLLEMLGVKTGLKKLLGKITPKKETDPEKAGLRDFLLLPIVKVLDEIGDPRAPQALEFLLEHEDHLVRWHMVRMVMNAQMAEVSTKIHFMAEHDANELVREMAQLALAKLNPLPPNMNN